MYSKLHTLLAAYFYFPISSPVAQHRQVTMNADASCINRSCCFDYHRSNWKGQISRKIKISRKTCEMRIMELLLIGINLIICENISGKLIPWNGEFDVSFHCRDWKNDTRKIITKWIFSRKIKTLRSSVELNGC